MTYSQIFLIFALVFTTTSYAKTDCSNAQSTYEMSACGGIFFTKADEELNAVYVRLLKILDAEGQRRLKESQRAWVKFRDLNADFRGDSNRGGSLEPIVGTASKTEITLQRIQELKDELEIRK